MSNMGFGTKTIQQYIKELENCETCTAAEAAALAVTVSQQGLDALTEEQRVRFVNYCALVTARRVRAAAQKTSKTPKMSGTVELDPCEWVNEFHLRLEETLRRYDPERSSLPTFLSNSVDNFIRSYNANNGFCGRYYNATVSQLRRAREKYIRLNSCEPTDDELMTELNWGRLRLNNARRAEAEGVSISLNEPVDESGELTLADTLVSDQPSVEEAVENKIMLGKMRECLAQLPDDRNKYATINCIMLGKSYGKVGEELGASKEGVRKMVTRTLDLLRTMLCG